MPAQPACAGEPGPSPAECKWGPGGEGRGRGRPLSGRRGALASAYSGPGESVSLGTELAAPLPHAG